MQSATLIPMILAGLILVLFIKEAPLRDVLENEPSAPEPPASAQTRRSIP